MNIIWLTPEIPYPPIGGRNGVFNRIVQLSNYNSIYLFSIAYSEEEKNQSSNMGGYCTEVHYYNRNANKSKVILKSIIMPFSVASRTIPELEKDICNLLDRVKIDAIIIDFPNMAKNILDISPKNSYCTLNQHNIEFKRMREMSKVDSISWVKRLAYYLESYRLELYERRLYKSGLLNSITFFSKDDLQFFQGRWKNNNIAMKVFPLGANSVNQKIPKVNSNTLLFIGRMDKVAIPNVEAALWMANDILPIIKEKVRDVKLILAGANPSEDIVALQNESIQIVPNYNELADAYSLSDIVVLPLKSGGGVKGKLLEAAAFGKIIISTEHGFEGTDFLPGKHLLLGRTKDEFAQECIKALCDKDSYYPMAENARQLFEDEYEWKAIGRAYNQFIQDGIKCGDNIANEI